MKPSARLAASGSRARSLPAIVTLPGRGLEQARDHADRRGLAGAVRAQEAVDLAGPTSRLTPSTARKAPKVLTSESTAITGDLRGRLRTSSRGRSARGAGIGSSSGARSAVSRPDQHRHGAGPQLDAQDVELGAADQADDRGLLVEAAAREPHVGGVGRELVERGIDRGATGRGPAPRRRTPRATRGSRRRRAGRRGRPRSARAARSSAPSPRRARCARCSRRRASCSTSSADGRLTVGRFSMMRVDVADEALRAQPRRRGARAPPSAPRPGSPARRSRGTSRRAA